MHEFVFNSLPGRVVFGSGTINELANEVAALGSRRAMLIAAEHDQGLTQLAEGELGSALGSSWRQVVQHVPGWVAERATEHATRHGADVLVTIGGGSTTGLGKAVARRLGLPLVAVPTTYAGSEMTPIWGETSDGKKVTGRDLSVLPATVIYDVDLTLTLPPGISASSGVNALAHCVEAIYARGASPLATATALRAIESLVDGLPRVVKDPSDATARADVLIGAYLSGSVLATAGISVHHHVCHVLGGMFDLPHAELHSVVLPYALREVAIQAPRALDPIERMLGVSDLSVTIGDLTRTLGLPRSLAALGMSEEQAELAVPAVVASTASDPTPLGLEEARRLLLGAGMGTDPAPRTTDDRLADVHS